MLLSSYIFFIKTKKIIKLIFNYFNLEIRKKAPTQGSTTFRVNPFTMSGGIVRAKLRGINPSTVIDVGAAEGKWTLSSMNTWPNSDYILFEPLEERQAQLSALEKKYKNVRYVNAGVGDKKGTVDFYVTDDLDGSGIADNGSNAKLRKIEITTIDDEMNRLKLQSPYVLKLDTHGYEVPILEGAIHTLKQTQLIIIECYGFQIAPGSLLFWEMCRYMEQKGFRLIDIVDIMSRPKDNSFWQCDAFFIPHTSSCFSSNTYH